MERQCVHEQRDSLRKKVSALPRLFLIKMPGGLFYRHKRLLPDLFEKGRWTRAADLVWERMKWDDLFLLQVTLAYTVWHWKMRGARRWYMHQLGPVENPGTDSQGCSIDFDKCTEAIQGAGELISGTRVIGHLSEILKEPELRWHCRRISSKGRPCGLTCKTRDHNLQKNTKEKLFSLSGQTDISRLTPEAQSIKEKKIQCWILKSAFWKNRKCSQLLSHLCSQAGLLPSLLSYIKSFCSVKD